MTTIKRHDSTYFVENEWVDKNGKKQNATVRLEIDYINKKCSIKPAISEKFLFVNGNLDEWIAVVNCIRNAAEFAQIELGEKETKDTIDLSRVPEMCTNLIRNPIPDCKTYSHNEYGEITISSTPDLFDFTKKYSFFGGLEYFNHKEVIDHFETFVKEKISDNKFEKGEIAYVVLNKHHHWAFTPVLEPTDIIIAKYKHF